MLLMRWVSASDDQELRMVQRGFSREGAWLQSCIMWARLRNHEENCSLCAESAYVQEIECIAAQW